MNRILVPLRYAFFFVLASLFAVQTAVASWNIQIKQSLTHHHQVDSFLITCGALGLLVLFPITFIDILRKNSLTSRVWFEASWLALFFLLETAGAAALTALLPDLDCRSSDPACASTIALTGITWTLAVLPVIYMTSLIVSAILHHHDSPHVWQSGVRDFPWFPNTSGKRLPSPPCSPRKWKSSVMATRPVVPTAPALVTPKPRRTQPPPFWTAYEIEHFQASHLEDQVNIEPMYHPSASSSNVPHASEADQSGFYASHLNRWISSTNRMAANGETPIAEQPPVIPPRSNPSASRRPPQGPRNRPPPLDLTQVTNHW